MSLYNIGGNSKLTHVLLPSLNTAAKDDSSAITASSYTYLNDRFVEGAGQDITLDHLDMTEVVTNTAASGVRGSIKTYEFDDTSDEYVVFTAKTPADYTQRAMDIVLNWTSNTAGYASWGAEIDAYGTGTSVDTNSYGPMTFTSGYNMASGYQVATAIPMSTVSMNSLGRNEPYSVRISRVPQSGFDSVVGDASLLFVEMRESYRV